MIRWFRSHAAALADSAGRLARAPVATLSLLVTLAVALAVPLLGFVLLSGLAEVADRFGGAPQLALYLDPRVPPTQLAALVKALEARRDIAEVRVIGRDQALADLAGIEGVGDLLAGLTTNPLPDALLVTPAGRDPRQLAALRAELVGMPGVAEIQLDTAWVERLDALVRAGQAVLGVLAALMAAGVVATTFAVTRLQVLTRMEELTVCSLFGATPAQLRRPFLYLGALQGLLAGLLAGAIATLAALWLRREIGPVLTALGFPTVALPPPADVGAVALFAAVLGWIGAWVSVSRHARRLEPQ